jgi:hypothetical protein
MQDRASPSTKGAISLNSGRDFKIGIRLKTFLQFVPVQVALILTRQPYSGGGSLQQFAVASSKSEILQTVSAQVPATSLTAGASHLKFDLASLQL